MASTNNAENFMKIARIVYQLCDYTHFRADFLQTSICGEWVVYAERVTYMLTHTHARTRIRTRTRTRTHTHTHTYTQLARVDGHPSMSLHSQAKTKDLKLIFVPLIFILLRLWGAILVILYLASYDKFRVTKYNAILVLLSVSYLVSDIDNQEMKD